MQSDNKKQKSELPDALSWHIKLLWNPIIPCLGVIWFAYRLLEGRKTFSVYGGLSVVIIYLALSLYDFFNKNTFLKWLYLEDDAVSEWKLHIPDESNKITHYKCGLVAGQRVRLKKELVIEDINGKPTGEIYPIGEEWEVLVGITTDPVLWFRQADGERHTWDDDVDSVNEWFEKI